MNPSLLFLLTIVLSVSISNCWIQRYRFRKNLDQIYPKDPRYATVDPGEPLLLSPLIEKNYLEAQNASEVHHEDFKNIKSYSGFITVNKTFNSNLFFWFFLAEENYLEAPVVVWLQGGPGGSSLFGLFVENGPFEFGDDDQFRFRNFSWTKQHSVLFIDNPAGTGFSFTNDGGYAREETQIGAELYEFLIQFFKMFPELQKNDFFITGESYAGKYIPAIGYTILKKNPSATLKINLQGLAIGDGLSDPVHQYEYADYLYQIGLIDVHKKAAMKVIEARLLKSIKDENWKAASEYSDVLTVMYSEVSGLQNLYNYLSAVDPTERLESLATNYVERNDIRRALHVGSLEYGSDEVSSNLQEDMMKSVAPWVSELLSNYRVMLYTGQVDVIVAYPLTLNYLQHLDFSGAKEYKVASRKQWSVNGRLAGYVKEAGNLSEVLVRDAGHMVPYDQPEWAYDLIYKFTRNIPLYSRG